MNVYVFGNEDEVSDNAAFKVMAKLQGTIEGVNFIKVKPNEDLPFADEPRVTLIDTLEKTEKVTLIDETNLDKLVLSPRVTAHDFDLGFQLKLLNKLGKLKKVKIIGVPRNGQIDYDLIQSILRKLVEQEIHGS